MRIDKAEIERVKRAHDLVAVIRSKGIRLERKGKQYVGLCPFHADHEPSLIVDPQRRRWPRRRFRRRWRSKSSAG